MIAMDFRRSLDSLNPSRREGIYPQMRVFRA